MSRIQRYFEQPAAPVQLSPEQALAALGTEFAKIPDVCVSLERYQELRVIHSAAVQQLNYGLEHGHFTASMGRELQLTAAELTKELEMTPALTVSNESFDVGNEGFKDVWQALTGTFKKIGSKLRDIGSAVKAFFIGIVGDHKLRVRAQIALNQQADALRKLLEQRPQESFEFNLRPFSQRMARGRLPQNAVIEAFSGDLAGFDYALNNYMTDSWAYIGTAVEARNDSIERGLLTSRFDTFIKQDVPGFVAWNVLEGGGVLMGGRYFVQPVIRNGDNYRKLGDVRGYGFLRYGKTPNAAPMLNTNTLTRDQVKHLIGHLEFYGALLVSISTHWQAMPDLTALYRYQLDDDDLTDAVDEDGNYLSSITHVRDRFERAVLVELDDVCWTGYWQLGRFLQDSFKALYENAVTLGDLLRANLK